jgi:hypothetical protein
VESVWLKVRSERKIISVVDGLVQDCLPQKHIETCYVIGMLRVPMQYFVVISGRWVFNAAFIGYSLYKAATSQGQPLARHVQVLGQS